MTSQNVPKPQPSQQSRASWTDAKASTMTLRPSSQLLVTSSSRTFGQAGPATSWTSIKDMPVEISNYAIDKAVWENAKANDTQRHNLDEKLDAFQKTIICINGNESEKIFAAHEIVSLVKINADRAFKEILPLIEEELKKSNGFEFHSTTATSLGVIFRDMMKARNPKRIKHILDFVNAMMNNPDIELMANWLETMETIIDLMSPKDATHQILPLIQERVKPQKSPESKKAACVLIRKLVKRDNSSTPLVLQIVIGLTKDENSTVRMCACMLLPTCMLFSDLPTVKEFENAIVAFADDSSLVVKSALVEAIGGLFSTGKKELFSVEIVLGILKKVVKNGYCQEPQNVSLLTSYSKYITIIARTCNEKYTLSVDDKLWFLDSFLHLSRYDLPASTSGKTGKEIPQGFVNFRNKMEVSRALLDSLLSTPCSLITKEIKNTSKNLNNNDTSEVEKWMCRSHCASNFIDFVTFAKPLVDFKGGLQNIANELVHDPNPNVRKNMAANMFLLMEKVGDQAGSLKDCIVRVLSDDNVDVIEAIVPHLANIMKMLVKTQILNPDHPTTALNEIGGVILFCEERLSQTRDWRIHSSLLLQMVVLPFCIPCDYIYTNFVPILLHRLLHLSQLPSRLGAAEALVSFLRHCRRANQRDDIRRKIRGFAQSRSAQDRMLYLYMSNMIMDRFSRKYFRDHFFDTTVGLTDDKIPNVRTKAYRLMPKMKERTRNADDATLLKKLEAVVQKIQSTETDRDAVEAMLAAVAEMAKIDSYLKGEQGNRKKGKEDLSDQKKEKEEAFIAGLEAKMPKVSPLKRLSTDKGTVNNAAQKPESLKVAPPNHVSTHPRLSTGLGNKTATENKAPNNNTHKPSTVIPRSSGFQLPPQQGRNIVPLAKKKSDLHENNSSRTTASLNK